MSDSTEVTSNRAITVPFHGAELYVVEHNGQPYTPMKPIVLAMGLNWKSQHRKMAANESRWGMVELTIPSAGGDQAMTCLPIRKTAAWLTTIESGKVKNPEVRARVIQYQNECDDALWHYWSEGVAVNARAAQPVQATLDYDRISPAQAQDLKQIVQAIVDACVQNYAETWRRLQNKFKVNSYLALRPDQYEAARAYLIAKLPNGYAGDDVQEAVPELGVNLFAKQAMQHAQINAASYMRKWREQQALGKDGVIAAEQLPAEVLAGLVAEQLMQQRWLVGYDYGRGGLLAQSVAKEEFVCSWAQLARGIACGDRQATTAELVDLASACNQQLVNRMGNPALVLAV